MSEITLFDLPSKQGTCWSFNSWKTRLALNFKHLDDKTVWVEYPDIEPTFSPQSISPLPLPRSPKLNLRSIPPNAPPDTPYTIPGLGLGPTTVIMHSRAIAARLESLHPEPSLHLDSPILAQVYTIQAKHVEPLYGLWMPLVSANLLPPRSKEYFDRTREEDAGMPLPKFLAETEELEEEVWEAARDGLRELGELLEENGNGPFFMGSIASYADFVVLGWLQFYRRIDEERLFDRVLKMEPALGRLYEAGKQWLKRDDH